MTHKHEGHGGRIIDTKISVDPHKAENASIYPDSKFLYKTTYPDFIDPMSIEFWSATMSIAWIVFRTTDSVRECWDSCHTDSRTATIEDLRLSELSHAYHRDRQIVVRVADAIHMLWSALRTGRLSAVVTADDLTRKAAAAEWASNAPSDEIHALDFTGQLNAVRGGDHSQVLFDRASIVSLWPEQKVLDLPEVIAPKGPGHMPLFQAALWIATKGGQFTFHPEEIEFWRTAFADLFAQIASDRVDVTGVANGVREAIDGHLLADCRVVYPYSAAELDLLFSDELFLVSHPFIGDAEWRGGFDDSLQSKEGVRWARLMVRKDRVLELWPFDVNPPQSGAPGRPTSMHLVLAEFERMVTAGERPATLAEASRVLAVWLRRTHPTYPPATVKTIQSGIRQAFNATRAPRH